MARATLQEIALDVPALRGVFVATLPEGHLHDAWMRPKEPWSARHVAGYFSDLHRANKRALEALGATHPDAQVTIESGGMLIVIREVRPDFVAAFAFDKSAAPAAVGPQVKRMMQRLQDVLPSSAPELRERGVRVLEFLDRYAPDAHAVLLRVSLKTGIPLERLQAPASLDDEQVERIEVAVKDVLGLESLDV